MRWGRGLLGEGMWRGLAAGGGRGDGMALAWRSFGAGAAAAPEVFPIGGCPRGPRPCGRTWTGAAWQHGDPSPLARATGSLGRPHGGLEPATPSAERSDLFWFSTEPGILVCGRDPSLGSRSSRRARCRHMLVLPSLMGLWSSSPNLHVK